MRSGQRTLTDCAVTAAKSRQRSKWNNKPFRRSLFASRSNVALHLSKVALGAHVRRLRCWTLCVLRNNRSELFDLRVNNWCSSVAARRYRHFLSNADRFPPQARGHAHVLLKSHSEAIAQRKAKSEQPTYVLTNFEGD